MNLRGFSLPPEWAPHEATWLSWPVNEDTWPSHLINDVLVQYVDFVAEISQVEKVRINLQESKKELAFAQLDKNKNVNIRNIEFYNHQTNDAWCRDHGPDFLVNNKEKIVLNWEYNAWGGKYPPFDLDNGIPNKVADALDLSQLNIPVVLEGGAFDVNGQGVCITTESCLLNKNRNPHLSKSQIEVVLKNYLKQEEIIWLFNGITGDDTDGHVDDITRFVNASNLVTCVSDLQNKNFEILDKNRRYLADNFKNRFNIVDLPMPKPLYIDQVEVPASYANFYILNSKVIVPIFNDENDLEALSILKECFPDRQVVGLDASKIIYGLGSFHCLSKQEPKTL